jgi:D-amino-acid dehydrogenase
VAAARRFAAAVSRCAERGAVFLYGHEVQGFDTEGRQIAALRVRRSADGRAETLRADAYVAATGSFTAPLLRPLGIYLNIYSAKGYSATLALKQPAKASVVSMIDDARKIAISRLGDRIRIAGTAEMAGYDTVLDSRTSRLRCAALVRRYEELFPGVADTSEPNFWTGPRPSTPDNIPVIGRSRLHNLWVNAGHGTLGWTHGAGSGRALAELMSGQRPALAFRFSGEPRSAHSPLVLPAPALGNS